ncbi:MAG: hypothetical protein LQ343_004081 [Gyalolechia ehrenbergii]|nr:MAG: hypothetical protein LQ343_004081 [Gyalolechia ehrenbergii]
MAAVAPDLPVQGFPCWVRALYSWGGEAKGDLGFVEGDLIEALNAGDSNFWCGRLRRDKRSVGLFPSNFVKVLDQHFQPVSRSVSPIPPPQPPNTNPSPKASKSVFRKPFQAYSAFNGNSDVSRNSSVTTSTIAPPKPKSRRPYQSYGQSPKKPPDDAQKLEVRSKGPSPLPSRQSSSLQQSSDRPSSSRKSKSNSRLPSPMLSMVDRHTSATTYPDLKVQDERSPSPPPPPPPVHRIPYQSVSIPRTPSPALSMNHVYPTISRGASPVPPSPGGTGLTPSPLRDAMEDVMTSLQDMEMRQDSPSEIHGTDRAILDPWSPEAFEELRTKPRDGVDRPRTSLGIVPPQADEQNSHYYNSRPITPEAEYQQSPLELDNYAQRMESRLRAMQETVSRPHDELFLPDESMQPPPVPAKNSPFQPRTNSAQGVQPSITGSFNSNRKLRSRKSAYELGRDMLGRTFTNKSSTTNSSSGVQSNATSATTSSSKTSQSLMSGYSAGGFSATSAGSLARRKGWGSISRSRPMSVVGDRQDESPILRNAFPPRMPTTGDIYPSRPESSAQGAWARNTAESDGALGGLTAPKPKKSGFFKKLVESAKTSAASARSSIAAGQAEPPRSPIKNLLPNGVTAIAGGSAARDMGLGPEKTGMDWVQVRRDINRSNSLSRNERVERVERCQMMDYPVVAPIEALLESTEGDEGLDGLPVEDAIDFSSVNYQLVDKSARFVNSLPPMTNPASLAQGYVCRPYRSDVQRLRAIFTWVGEKVAWEEDFEGEVDPRRVIQMRRGCSEEVAVLVMEMCSAMGVHAEVVRGYLKTPGELADLDVIPRPNHWWNAVIVDNSWRIMDCSLASPTNPKRGLFSSVASQVAESGWFLTRPLEACYTHVPQLLEQQHICPPVAPDILLALPCACPPYFKNDLQMVDYDTSLYRVDNLELVQIQFNVPADIECFAETEARSYARDADGDWFESGDTVTTRALAQAEWVAGQKRYTVKAHLPGDEGQGTLKVYAGKRGLMHSAKDNPHPLAFTVPIIHTGSNPPYEFLLRHPTPHAQRHDLYVAQPQCRRLAVNNTFVFAVRQHPSSLSCTTPPPSAQSPLPFARPTSAMSMISTSVSGSDYFSQQSSSSSNGSAQQQQTQQQHKPAKLAIQAPSGKILRLSRKSDNTISNSGAGGGDGADGGVWETIIKIGERGTWRGLVLADRSARWCVFGEWECY